MLVLLSLGGLGWASIGRHGKLGSILPGCCILPVLRLQGGEIVRLHDCNRYPRMIGGASINCAASNDKYSTLYGLKRTSFLVNLKAGRWRCSSCSRRPVAVAFFMPVWLSTRFRRRAARRGRPSRARSKATLLFIFKLCLCSLISGRRRARAPRWPLLMLLLLVRCAAVRRIIEWTT